MSDLEKQTMVKTAERKTHRIELRVGDRDLQIIEANAKQVGLNRSQFLISRGKKQTYPIARHLPNPDYANLMLACRELKSQGNALKQIGRAMNRALLEGKHCDLNTNQLQQLIQANDLAIQTILIALTQSYDDR